MKPLLVLVVGPSGAGKDSVIRGAEATLKNDPRFYFARRMVTRNTPQAGEINISAEAFRQHTESGYFAKTWDAHQLSYGLPRSELQPQNAAVQIIIANVSRTVLNDLLAEHGGHVLYITASPSEIRRRLEKRHRESAASINDRLRRHIPLPDQLPMTTIRNDGLLEEAIKQCVHSLIGLVERP
ncbi:PhnN protein [Acidithiobacillus thiooxidans]|jgi:phosphonate metabolism protein PhnN/1,5-bisphosphokinase (PRPP-forming)|uniref:PhnN protein n=1 Tax=Acidithiobacillus thiooxidans TaxID=930 RepID=UPI001C07B211|nr:PhnN protein [Acidithiobacillus thiooxidans]MBU2838508.1 PhnN protein [Acidithiobacillus thiooxidans]MBU2843749.1 PhnN protein [Acidithiobacillus thiooxidans]